MIDLFNECVMGRNGVIYFAGKSGKSSRGEDDKILF
jgi:hypothetical protein